MNCVDCGKELIGLRPHRIRSNPNRRCKSCFDKTVKHFTINEGYMRRTDGKHEYEHRLVMERKIKRPLLRRERVHHKNEVRTDNTDSNLKLCASAGAHVWGEGHVARGPDGRFRSKK
jgi:hypothetical protein